MKQSLYDMGPQTIILDNYLRLHQTSFLDISKGEISYKCQKEGRVRENCHFFRNRVQISHSFGSCLSLFCQEGRGGEGGPINFVIIRLGREGASCNLAIVTNIPFDGLPYQTNIILDNYLRLSNSLSYSILDYLIHHRTLSQTIIFLKYEL